MEFFFTLQHANESQFSLFEMKAQYASSKSKYFRSLKQSAYRHVIQRNTKKGSRFAYLVAYIYIFC